MIIDNCELALQLELYRDISHMHAIKLGVIAELFNEIHFESKDCCSCIQIELTGRQSLNLFVKLSKRNAPLYEESETLAFQCAIRTFTSPPYSGLRSFWSHWPWR